MGKDALVNIQCDVGSCVSEMGGVVDGGSAGVPCEALV